MKKLLLLPAGLLLLIISLDGCKKSSGSSGSYSVTANIAGTNTAFNTAAYATVEAPFGGIQIEWQAVGNAPTGENILVTVSNTNPGAKIQLGKIYTDTMTDWDVEAVYTQNISNIFEAGTEVELIAESIPVSLTNHLKVTFTSIDSTAVKGTFSGDFYLNQDPSTNPKSITNGSFFVKVQH